MVPYLKKLGGESGINRVIEAYNRYLPDFGVTLIDDPYQSFDLFASHAGLGMQVPDVCHCHGLYWTADYAAQAWEWATNSNVIRDLRAALRVTVPSAWVAEAFQRDMHFTPDVIGHGIDLEAWGAPGENAGYVLWNKNRTGDVCDPRPMTELARRCPDLHFVSTFADGEQPSNVRLTGLMRHDQMKGVVKQAGVYLATTKETFGIGTLEALASGVPVLGWRHGGILEYVVHGLNGYLASVGDYDELEAGLRWCAAHRASLSRNALHMVSEWTWPRQVAKVADTYRLTLEAKQSPASVAIIIPTYNYAGRVSDAIRSAASQDYIDLKAIVVVDDGSTDNTGDVVQAMGRDISLLQYIRQDNAGVAHARNRGIAWARERGIKYVCCLDADDKIDPTFLSVCIRALQADASLGIAYTGLTWHKPDGTSDLSKWPTDWDYNAQLLRRNQVPTCCVFRTEMWSRLGGYRQRYAPHGAGSEDAEFWLRAGAIGYAAKRVTNEGLFHYSWMSGHVSGNADYREIDWLPWHPWAGKKGNGQHPFASYAQPARYSHPVRQYDTPLVTVVIPCGPGHRKYLVDALDSLEGQTFTKWEAIVVDDTGDDPDMALLDAYPFARFIFTAGRTGAGACRNLGAREARGSFLLWLDADDYLLPWTLDMLIEAWRLENAIPYCDYIGRAFVDPKGLAKDLQDNIIDFDERTKEARIGYRSADYDCERAIRQPEAPLYHWALVTCLVPKAWHDEISGFDENMKSWEDVDYQWRLARAGKCFIRVPEQGVVYRFYTGGRRELGVEGHKDLIAYMQEKYAKEQPMGCGCRGGRTSGIKVAEGQLAPFAVALPAEQEAKMQDQDYLLTRYTHPNRGQHIVLGLATGTRYGFRGGGEVFLVHRKDIEVQPHLFEVVPQEVRAVAPVVPQPEPPPPPDVPANVPTAFEVEAGHPVKVDGTLTKPKKAKKKSKVAPNAA